MEKDTVSIHFVVAAVGRLSLRTREKVLLEAGVSPGWLAVPRARVPARAFSALWLAVARELDDEFFGLDSRRMKVGSFALLSRAALPSPNLEHALRQIVRGFEVLLDDVSVTLRHQNKQAIVFIENRIQDAAARRFADETLLVMICGLLCWLARRRIPLSEVSFAFERPQHAAEYAVMFSEHMSFGAPASSITLEWSALATRVAQDAASLKTFLRSAPQSVFLKYRNGSGMAARVRRRLRRGLGQDAWPALDDLAQEFRLTPATLRRRLEAEGTSVQDIKNRLRQDIALHHLCHTKMPVAEIATLLGFQEPSAFHRAFKRWCGFRPGEYRRLLGADV